MSRGSLGTWLSGVFRSSFKMSLGGLVGGGSGYRASAGAELLRLELGVELLLASDFGGEGGNRRLVSSKSFSGFFVCASVGGGSATVIALMDMICYDDRKKVWYIQNRSPG